MQDVLLSKDTNVIGLDQERMPDNLRLFHKLPEHCQTLQIAARQKTFVFDLSKFKALAQMEECFRQVFERDDMIKIGKCGRRVVLTELISMLCLGIPFFMYKS